MKKIIYLIILVNFFQAKAQEVNIKKFNEEVNKILKQDNLEFKDLDTLITFKNEIKYQWSQAYLSIDDKILYKKVNNLIEKKKLSDSLNFNIYIDNLDTEKIYIFTLFTELGKDIPENAAIFANVKYLFPKISFLLGGGFILQTSDSTAYDKTIIGYEIGLDIYPFKSEYFNYRMPVYICTAVGFNNIVGLNKKLNFLVPLQIGFGSDKTENAFELLYAFVYDQGGGNNINGVVLNIRSSNEFTFGASLYFSKGYEYCFFNVKYNFFNSFRRLFSKANIKN